MQEERTDMITLYENHKYMHIPLKYRGITNIIRKCNVFTLDSVIWQPRDVDYSTAIKTLVGIYYHFLVSGGHIMKSLAVASDPSLICLNLTESENKDGDPVLSATETAQFLGYILHGLYCFHNKKCRNTSVMHGMAYLVRKLYEPFMRFGDSYIQELYYAIIARGTFVLQMNNKLLAKAFYKGLYDVWPYAKDRQKYFFGGMSYDVQAAYDSVLNHEDLFFDPMRDGRKYPWNMYEYNVDNIILTYAAAKEMKDVGEKTRCFSPDDIKKYGQVMDFIYDFFTRVSPFYKVRCDYYNARYSEYLKETDPVEYYGNVGHVMEKYPVLQMDYCPYLFYSCELFKSTEKPETHLYAGIAKNYTGRDYDRLDKDCPIFGQRIGQPEQGESLSVALNTIMDGAVAITMAFWVINCICEWQKRTHGLTFIFWGVIILFFLGCAGAGSKS